jgi:pimeloyl-ACP methyl ester carboxylesterase
MRMTADDLDEETETIFVGQGPIEYEELAGSPELSPLVFLHEGLGALRLWRDFPHALATATGRRSLVFSRHGYGRSTVVTEPREVDYMHREALEVFPDLLGRLGYKRPVLVGHSDGASIALIHAGAGAGQPAGLVLLAPHVIVEDRSIEGIEATRDAYLTGDIAERMSKYHTDAASTFWGWNDIWLSPEFRGWNITHFLPGVSCPVLLIQCLDDPYGTLAQLNLIEVGVSGPTRRVILADCGHAPHQHQPEATLSAITSFLAELG